MIIIWGSKGFQKLLGYTQMTQCAHCNNINPFQVLCVRTWFTLFWIPIFPFSTKYLIMCPICGYGSDTHKEYAMQQVASVSLHELQGGQPALPGQQPQNSQSNFCPACGQALEYGQDIVTCPECGTRCHRICHPGRCLNCNQ
jgi:hypothetical protein